MPKVIAIIMDGNGRWAKQNGFSARTKGHEMGAKVVRQITTFCAQKGVEKLILYAFSTENWARPKAEVGFLMKLLKKYLKNELETLMKNDIRLEVIGDVSAFDEDLRAQIKQIVAQTSQNKAMTQVLALNYGAKNELSRAVKTLAQTKPLGELSNKQIEDALNAHLDCTSSIDMLVRTGGEMRLSNFLLWQAAYAELFFTPTLWPDFTKDELARMMDEFKLRIRRFGGL
ncbi:MAG: di-trans,poly-cis-decaprenylcistransferase [Deltaproteobacteria bacterium]|nr:MAG: di-trans,poly-cis-decaprenylcistransferase [Deltaproteobacteria bacterium]